MQKIPKAKSAKEARLKPELTSSVTIYPVKLWTEKTMEAVRKITIPETSSALAKTVGFLAIKTPVKRGLYNYME